MDVVMIFQKNLRELAVAGALILSLGLIAGGYYWYRSATNQKAQALLAQCLEEYERALYTNEAHMWHDVQMASSQGYERSKSSDLAPFFKSIQADAFYAQDKKEEALEALSAAVDAMSTSSPLYYLYATKLALMEYDYKGSSERLMALAQNTKNPYKDMAQYYVGYYLLAQDKQIEARAYWKDLLQQNSVWAQQAQAQLGAY